GRRVVEIAVEVREADDGRDSVRRRRDLGERLLVRANERWFEQEVLGRIAGDDQLGERDDIGADVARTLDAVADDAGVPVDIPDRGIDLRKREAQRPHTTIVRWLRVRR